MKGRFVRLAEQGRPKVSLTVDGAAVEALQGDTRDGRPADPGQRAAPVGIRQWASRRFLPDGRVPGLLGVDPQWRTSARLFQ